MPPPEQIGREGADDIAVDVEDAVIEHLAPGASLRGWRAGRRETDKTVIFPTAWRAGAGLRVIA
jgi:hypothetical protein